MPKATLCADVGTPERAILDAWLERWGDSLPFLPANEGCGCCVDIYRVDAPPDALEQLPPSVFTASDWSDYNPIGDLSETLASLGRTGKASDRKLRLFTVACYRRMWDVLEEATARSAVELAERYIEGKINSRQLWATRQQLRESIALLSGERQYMRRIAIEVALGAVSPTLNVSIAGEVTTHLQSAWCITSWQSCGSGPAGRAPWLALLADIFDDPSGSWPSLDAPRDVLNLARSAYENRTLPEGTLEPARLAALADALEAAGCTDSEVLGHLRLPGLHWRGCWAVDVILGRT